MKSINALVIRPEFRRSREPKSRVRKHPREDCSDARACYPLRGMGKAVVAIKVPRYVGDPLTEQCNTFPYNLNSAANQLQHNHE